MSFFWNREEAGYCSSSSSCSAMPDLSSGCLCCVVCLCCKGNEGRSGRLGNPPPVPLCLICPVVVCQCLCCKGNEGRGGDDCGCGFGGAGD